MPPHPRPGPLCVLENMALSCRSTDTSAAGSHSLGALLPQAQHPPDLSPVRTAIARACPTADHMSPGSAECALPLLCLFSLQWLPRTPRKTPEVLRGGCVCDMRGQPGRGCTGSGQPPVGPLHHAHWCECGVVAGRDVGAWVSGWEVQSGRRMTTQALVRAPPPSLEAGGPHCPCRTCVLPGRPPRLALGHVEDGSCCLCSWLCLVPECPIGLRAGGCHCSLMAPSDSGVSLLCQDLRLAARFRPVTLALPLPSPSLPCPVRGSPVGEPACHGHVPAVRGVRGVCSALLPGGFPECCRLRPPPRPPLPLPPAFLPTQPDFVFANLVGVRWYCVSMRISLTLRQVICTSLSAKFLLLFCAKPPPPSSCSSFRPLALGWPDRDPL